MGPKLPSLTLTVAEPCSGDGVPQVRGLEQTIPLPYSIYWSQQRSTLLNSRLPDFHTLIVLKALESTKRSITPKSRGSLQPDLSGAQDDHHPAKKKHPSGNAEYIATHPLLPHEKAKTVLVSSPQNKDASDALVRLSHEKIMSNSLCWGPDPKRFIRLRYRSRDLLHLPKS